MDTPVYLHLTMEKSNSKKNQKKNSKKKFKKKNPKKKIQKKRKSKKKKKKKFKKKKEEEVKFSYFKIQNEEVFLLFSSSFLPRISSTFQIFSKCHFPKFSKISKSHQEG